MTDEFTGSFELRSSPEATWAVIDDPAAIGRILPDCESVAPDGAGGLNVVVAIRQMLMTVRVDLHVTWHDQDRPRHLRLDLDGRPRGLGGAIHLVVPIELEPTTTGSRVSYHATLELDGSLSSFRRQVRDGLKVQVDRLIRALDQAASST